MSILKKITPGPWNFDGKEITALNGKYYIGYAEIDFNDPREFANATAIAAVPSMLTIIERLAIWGTGTNEESYRYIIVSDAIRLLTELNK